MVAAPASPSGSPAPFGSWTRTYLLVCVLAVAVMVALFWFSAHWNVRIAKS